MGGLRDKAAAPGRRGYSTCTVYLRPYCRGCVLPRWGGGGCRIFCLLAGWYFSYLYVGRAEGWVFEGFRGLVRCCLAASLGTHNSWYT